MKRPPRRINPNTERKRREVQANIERLRLGQPNPPDEFVLLYRHLEATKQPYSFEVKQSMAVPGSAWPELSTWYLENYITSVAQRKQLRHDASVLYLSFDRKPDTYEQYLAERAVKLRIA